MADENTQQPAPPMIEIARAESLSDPLTLSAFKMSSYVDILDASDSVLRQKGGIANLSIYRELMRDDQVSSTWMQRRLSVTSCDTMVEPGGKDAASKAAAEALQEDLDALNWDDVTDKMLFSLFYGWGVAEILWRQNGNRVSFGAIKVRDRARFRFDIRGGLHLWTAGSGFVEMPARKFWTMTCGADHHDDPYGLGLAHALYWPVFFKRNDIKFWLIFLEKFGMPTALAKLPKHQLEDPKERAKAIAMLRQIATDAGVVVPEDSDKGPIVELLEAARSGAADYDGMKSAMDSAISKIVVGQTMTTDNGSSLSQAKVHQGVAEKIVQADSDLLCGSFTAGPVRWWTEMNFPGATPPRVYRHTKPPEDLAARADRDTKIFSLGYEPDEEYIRETYGDGWVKKKAPEPLQGMPGAPGAMPTSAGGANFAESEAAALKVLRAARRGDQQALVDAAVAFAEQYQTIMGRQVGAILQAAEDAGDPAVFRERLNEILADDPAPEAVSSLTRANFFARMMGALRQQRRT